MEGSKEAICSATSAHADRERRCSELDRPFWWWMGTVTEFASRVAWFVSLFEYMRRVRAMATVIVKWRVLIDSDRGH
jgi:hypothetical protein